MNDTLLFQHIGSNSYCAQWLALTSPVTLRYCQQHQVDYQLVMAKRDQARGHWEVPRLLREFLGQGYTGVIYLDADTLIVDAQADVRQAIVPDRIGAVWHNSGRLSHFNAGALYVSNTERVRAFVDQWIAGAPGRGYGAFPLTWEQGILNVLGKQQGILQQLDNQWNAEDGVSPSEHPIILGFHGFPDRAHYIQLAVERLQVPS